MNKLKTKTKNPVCLDPYFCCYCLFVFSYFEPRSGIANSYSNLMLNFEGTDVLISRVCTTIPAAMPKFYFLSLTADLFSCFLKSRVILAGVTETHCGFHYIIMTNDVKHLFFMYLIWGLCLFKSFSHL